MVLAVCIWVKSSSLLPPQFFSAPYAFHHVVRASKQGKLFCNVIVLFGSETETSHLTLRSRSIFWIEIKWKCFHHKQASLWLNFQSYFRPLSPPLNERHPIPKRDFLQDLFFRFPPLSNVSATNSRKKILMQLKWGKARRSRWKLTKTSNMCMKTYDAVKKAGKSFHNTCPILWLVESWFKALYRPIW